MIIFLAGLINIGFHIVPGITGPTQVNLVASNTLTTTELFDASNNQYALNLAPPNATVTITPPALQFASTAFDAGGIAESGGGIAVPQFGLEQLGSPDAGGGLYTASLGTAGYLHGSIPVYLIFAEPGGNGNFGPDKEHPVNAGQIIAAVNTLFNSAYFTGLGQYVNPDAIFEEHGLSPQPFLAGTYVSAFNLPPSYSEDDINNLVKSANDNGVPEEDDLGGDNGEAIFAVFTPQGYTIGDANANGYHHLKQTGSVFPTLDLDYAPEIAVTSGQVDTQLSTQIGTEVTAFNNPIDSITNSFSHELVETITDPTGVQTAGFNAYPSLFPSSNSYYAQDGELSDNEAQLYSGYENGVSVQSYWSEGNFGFIIPGATPQNVGIAAGAVTVGLTAAPLTTDEQMTIASTSSGGVQLDVNGESFQYDPGQVTSINMTLDNGNNSVDLSNLPAGVAISITGGTGSTVYTVDNVPATTSVTINSVGTDSILVGTLRNVLGTVTIQGDGNDTLTVDDSSDSNNSNVSLHANSLDFNGTTSLISWTALTQLTYKAGSGNNTISVDGLEQFPGLVTIDETSRDRAPSTPPPADAITLTTFAGVNVTMSPDGSGGTEIQDGGTLDLIGSEAQDSFTLNVPSVFHLAPTQANPNDQVQMLGGSNLGGAIYWVASTPADQYVFIKNLGNFGGIQLPPILAGSLAEDGAQLVDYSDGSLTLTANGYPNLTEDMRSFQVDASPSTPNNNLNLDASALLGKFNVNVSDPDYVSAAYLAGDEGGNGFGDYSPTAIAFTQTAINLTAVNSQLAVSITGTNPALRSSLSYGSLVPWIGTTFVTPNSTTTLDLGGNLANIQGNVSVHSAQLTVDDGQGNGSNTLTLAGPSLSLTTATGHNSTLSFDSMPSGSTVNLIGSPGGPGDQVNITNLSGVSVPLNVTGHVNLGLGNASAPSPLTLSATTLTVNVVGNATAVVPLTVSGGTQSITGNLTASASINVSTGTLSVFGNLTETASITLSGGTLNVGGTLSDPSPKTSVCPKANGFPTLTSEYIP